MQSMLWKGAGFNRILPWKEDAGYYIGRYIGRDTDRTDWDFRAGRESVGPRQSVVKLSSTHAFLTILARPIVRHPVGGTDDLARYDRLCYAPCPRTTDRRARR